MASRKNRLIGFMFLAFLPVVLVGQVNLAVKIEGLQNNKGQIVLDFTNDKGETIKGYTQTIESNRCTFVIENLRPGKYAFRYFHDENKNLKLDQNWIGIPNEGLGFSNNAKGTFGPPPFGKTIFEIKEDTTVRCVPRYYTKE